MDELSEALKKHGNVFDVVLNECFENWEIGAGMRLIAMMARQVAANEKARAAATPQPDASSK